MFRASLVALLVFQPSFLLAGPCNIIETRTTTEAKSDDSGALEQVRLTSIKVMAFGAERPERKAMAKEIARRFAREERATQVEISFFANDGQRRRGEPNAYIAYTPDPSQLSFRKERWEGWTDPAFERIDSKAMDAMKAIPDCR